ncbi:hypothetical protein KC348_g10 [Hortaea werneckii]|nr:hypothetical protein KC348_g10 [Hortaea werneckii]
MPKLVDQCQQRSAPSGFGATHLLEVSLVRLWSIFATLKDDKRNGANHGYEVERQASKSSDSVACSARLDLTLFGNKFGVTCGAIERINQAILDQKSFRKHGCQRAALAKNQQGCAESRERTRSEEEDRELRDIGEKEHELSSSPRVKVPAKRDNSGLRRSLWLAR